MPKLNPDNVWYPPEFPESGRLPTAQSLTERNRWQQEHLEHAYHNELCAAAGWRVAPPCCRTLHISLFFDGTGNNLNYDLYHATPPHPTNIARIFRATIGQGYAGGAGDKNAVLVDQEGSAKNQYYKYYIPGVGTPFPEIMDLDYSAEGLQYAAYGEERINWGLLRVVDALRRILGLGKLSDGESWQALKAMATSWISFQIVGNYQRRSEFFRLLNKLGRPLETALTTPGVGQARLMGIKLYIYGFSRGAAAARTCVNWLNALIPPPEKGEPQQLCLPSAMGNIPISIEFFGLMDTVASVGIAHIAPVAEGHMSWADGTLALPDNGLIKRCVHMVSAHEQRLCFPLDSVCREDGSYPENSVEVVYPGMHSDIGGGYPPGDQGKGSGNDSRLLLSQIPLHDMYAEAFNAGAPLKVPDAALHDGHKKDLWRLMPETLQDEFYVEPTLVQRFNGWRQLTLGLVPSEEALSAEHVTQYSPVRADLHLIEALEQQIGWLTAWRINRYANETFRQKRFYAAAAANEQDQDNDPAIRRQRERDHKTALNELEKIRHAQRMNARDGEFTLFAAGPKDFDAALGQTQLLQAAIEFKEDYQKRPRTQAKSFSYSALDGFRGFIYAFNQDDIPVEFRRIKEDGERYLLTLFPPPGVQQRADDPAGLTRALFDDQIHDSRAWFMHSALGAREPWGSYFLYRIIYFGEAMSKHVKPLAMLGYVAGLAYPISTHDIQFIIDMVHNENSLAERSTTGEKITVIDPDTGHSVGVLQDRTQQLPCVHSSASVQAECRQALIKDFKQRKAAAMALLTQ